MFAITARNLITVLLINDEIILPIAGTPERRQHPKNKYDNFEADDNDYKNIPLDFTRLARANDQAQMTQEDIR